MSIADNKAALTAAGIDVDSVMQRFMGSERLTEKFMKRFADDMTFSQLEKAVAAGDSEEAFRAAHTLKGVAESGHDGAVRPDLGNDGEIPRP